MGVTAQSLRDAVCEVLAQEGRDLPVNAWGGVRARLFERLRHLGEGFIVRDALTTGEYLWDVTWTFEREGDDRYWVELAAEIELGDSLTENVRIDLYKLLDAKARLKLFVCAPPSRAMVPVLQAEIDRGWRRQQLQVPGEQLVAVLVDHDERHGDQRAWTRILDAPEPSERWHARRLTAGA